MISTQNISLRYGGRALFENVTVKFTPGNCYGLIGANGAGKSTFLKILSGDLEANKGDVVITPGDRLAVLKQNHFEYDEYTAINTVIMGHKRLYEIMQQKEKLYAKADFNDEDGVLLGELEGEFAELDGWNAESGAEILLNGLGIDAEFHYSLMKDLENSQKVKILLAQALFGNPDILLLDEPTNHLDLASVRWLEEFLINFENTVIVVSHDRYFLNKVCTHIADVDYGKIQIYVGNYDFWYEYTQMTLRQAKEQNKKAEAKKKELQEFIARFSANASKAKQATARKKLLDNLEFADMPASSRRYPFVQFKADREVGKEVLRVEGLSKTIGGRKVLDNISFVIDPHDKVAFVGADSIARTTLFKILVEELEPDSGTIKWGVTTSQAYFPQDNSQFFEGLDISLVDWVRQYSKDPLETTVRGWLGRMLFSGDEALKKANVLSGGERVRCMLCKLMLSGANVLVMDEPTNHLDLESITALNEGMINYKETLLFASHDHQFVQTIANRIIEVSEDGIIDKRCTYDEYLEQLDEAKLRKQINEVDTEED
ncbi:MAG: ATP-binding cassette domain-containing protein [Oscillospiraceae bacterium]|jgi:ATPase subunit of ABC transporter with duplicated ATPase domains|nr:ATP-binding cassette domain-containing protein [Oscillospiraceae bacterium]